MPDTTAVPDGALPPSDADDVVVTTPRDVAGGVPAVAATVRHTLRQLGAVEGTRLLGRVNQVDGFDCPSCAWPDPAAGQRSFAEFCENGAKAVADAATRARAEEKTFARHSVDELLAMSDRDLNRLGRLTRPFVRRAGHTHLDPISWDEAIQLTATTLRGLDSPDRATFYTSGRASNEAAFLYQLFVRAYGTNNLPDCSNMCHESSGEALSDAIGIGKGTVLLADVEQADVIVIIGQNPGTNHPRMLTALQRCVEDGGTIVAINPMREPGLLAVRNPDDFKHPTRAPRALLGSPTELASQHLAVRVAGDLALLTGVQKALCARPDGVDAAWVDANTSGFGALREHLAGQDWAELERGSGVTRAEMERLAATLASTDRIVWCWAMGITQSEHAVGTIHQVANLALLRGAIGKPGAGLCPVRGHSNVQGDRTVGIWDRPGDDLLDRIRDTFGFEPPREHGHDVVGSIEAMRDGDVQVVVSLGGNLLQAAPDTAVTAAALASTELAVHVATTLNRGHLVAGRTSLLLPCLSRTERDMTAEGQQFVSVESSMGVVSRSRGEADPASPLLRSEVGIVAALADATLGPGAPVDFLDLATDNDRIRDLIEATIPGFEGYNAAVRRDGGLELPNPPRHGHFDLPDGLAVLHVDTVPDLDADLPDGALMMATVRSHDQFNTTIYDNDDRYRGVRGGRRVVFVAPQDCRQRGLVTGDRVDLVGTDPVSRSGAPGGEPRRAPGFVVVEHDLPTGSCATYFPEANVLVPLERTAARSNTPVSKHVPVLLEAATR